MANTSVTYEGTGLTTTFSVPFPYIQKSHVKVYVNTIERLTPLHFTWVDTATISFEIAPLSGDGIVIRRVTPGDTRLVNFQDGAVLTEADLDLAVDQVFYMAQEAKENLTELVNDELIRVAGVLGIVETDPDAILAAMVTTALNDTMAAELLQRVTDIDTNAQNILDSANNLVTEIANRVSGDSAESAARAVDVAALQSQINALVEATVATVYVQTTAPVPGVGGIPNPIPSGARWYDSDDNNHPYLWDSVGLVWQDLRDPRIGANEADITALDVRLTTAEGNILADVAALAVLDATVTSLNGQVTANASSITSLSASVGTNTASILSEQSARAAADNAIASDVALLGVANGTDTAFILNTSTVKIDSNLGDTVAARLSALTAADGTNAASIVTEQSARAAADSAIAADVTALTATVGGNTAAISAEQSARASGDSAIAVDVALMGAANLTDTAFILNSATVKIDSDLGDTIATRLTALSAADSANSAAIASEETARISGDGANASSISVLAARVTTNENNVASNASAIVTEQTARASGDSANASSITALSSRVTTAEGEIDSAQVTISAHTSAITAVEGGVTSLEARYGVALDVNGYVSGFVLNNSGISSSMVIAADKFAIVQAAGPAETPIVPFSVAGGVVTMQNVQINGSLVVAGSINGTQIGSAAVANANMAANSINTAQIVAGAVTASEITVSQLSALTADLGAITAGNITLNTTGFIKGGQTAYNTGSGFFLGYNSAAYKFSIGDGGSNSLTWDGTTLTVQGNLKVGSYVVGTAYSLATAPTQRSSISASYTKVKEFYLPKDGAVTVRHVSWLDVGVGGPYSGTACVQFRDENANVLASVNVTDTSSSATTDTNVTLVANTTQLEIWVRDGIADWGGSEIPTGCNIKSVEVFTGSLFGESTTTD